MERSGEGRRARAGHNRPCSAASGAFPLCRAANMGEKSIDNHHPLCLHLSLIYGPAEKPCCPQLLGSQLLFARISSPLLPTQPPQQTASYNVQGCRGSWRVWWLVPAMPRPMVGCGKAQVGLSKGLGWQQGCGHLNEQHGGKEQSGGLQVKPTRKLHFALSV